MNQGTFSLLKDLVKEQFKNVQYAEVLHSNWLNEGFPCNICSIVNHDLLQVKTNESRRLYVLWIGANDTSNEGFKYNLRTLLMNVKHSRSSILLCNPVNMSEMFLKDWIELLNCWNVRHVKIDDFSMLSGNCLIGRPYSSYYISDDNSISNAGWKIIITRLINQMKEMSFEMY